MRKLLKTMIIVTSVGCMSMFNISFSEAKELKPSGFFADYSGFVESEESKGLFVKKNPDRSIGEYSKFLLEPITVYMAPVTGIKKLNIKRMGVNAKKLAELTEHFENEITRALSENYTVVNEPGEGVLRLRLAITDVKTNIRLLNIHSYTSFTGVGLGSASMEGEATDSVTGEQILAVVDSRKGKTMPKIKGQGAGDIAKEAFDNKLDSLTRYNTIKQIMTTWAERFAKKVDEQHYK